MAPPKPSAQTQLLLGRMDDLIQKDDERWDHVMESLDLLFAKVGDMDAHQQKVETKVDMATQVMEQLLKGQQLLSKQIEATGQAVAKLTLNQKEEKNKEPASPTSSDASGEQQFRHIPSRSRPSHQAGFQQQRREFGEKGSFRSMMPKLTFSRFEGDNPCIWKDKCLDYFRLFELPQSLWATMASLGMDGKAAKWLQVYKQKHGLTDWETFIAAVEVKFGDNDYRKH